MDDVNIIKKMEEDFEKFINGLSYEEKIIFLFAVMSNGKDGLQKFLELKKKNQNVVGDDIVYLNNDEKDFIIGCIIMAGKEGYYWFNIVDKCKDFSDKNIMFLLKKLGASEEEIKEIE